MITASGERKNAAAPAFSVLSKLLDIVLTTSVWCFSSCWWHDCTWKTSGNGDAVAYDMMYCRSNDVRIQHMLHYLIRYAVHVPDNNRSQRRTHVVGTTLGTFLFQYIVRKSKRVDFKKSWAHWAIDLFKSITLNWQHLNVEVPGWKRYTVTFKNGCQGSKNMDRNVQIGCWQSRCHVPYAKILTAPFMLCVFCRAGTK